MSASSHPPAFQAPTDTTNVDLNAAAVSGNLVISAETREDPVDRQHRHEQESADALLRRWKDAVRFGLSGILVAGITVRAFQVSADPSASGDERAWARTVLAAVLSAVAGYFIGKNTKE